MRKIQIGIQVWNLFAKGKQIMRAVALYAHCVSRGSSLAKSIDFVNE